MDKTEETQRDPMRYLIFVYGSCFTFIAGAASAAAWHWIVTPQPALMFWIALPMAGFCALALMLKRHE